jgi:hypothetical protein
MLQIWMSFLRLIARSPQKMKSAFLVVLGSVAFGALVPALPTAAQSASATTAPSAASSGVDAKAATVRSKLPFVARAPLYNGIPMEYRLVNIAGPKAGKIVEDYVEYGRSDFGTLILTKKEQLPAQLREPGDTCSTCAVESNRGLRLIEYFSFWIRGLSKRQRGELIATLEKL